MPHIVVRVLVQASNVCVWIILNSDFWPLEEQAGEFHAEHDAYPGQQHHKLLVAAANMGQFALDTWQVTHKENKPNIIQVNGEPRFKLHFRKQAIAPALLKYRHSEDQHIRYKTTGQPDGNQFIAGEIHVAQQLAKVDAMSGCKCMKRFL